MSHLDPARKTSPGELRKFGLLVGSAFLVLAAFLFWRQKPSAVVVGFTTLGGLLVILGLAVPKMLSAVYSGWMRFALLLSKVTTPILMGVIYFVLLTPIGLIMRAFGRNSLRAGGNGTAWHTRAEGARGSALERQF